MTTTIDLRELYVPTEKQAEAHQNGARFVLYGGAMRGGKSVWGCNEGLQLSLEYPGNRGLVCRWELPSLKRTTLTTLFEFLPDELIKHHNRQDGIIELLNGSSILYMGLKPSSEHSALERLKSLELGWFFIDEATEVEKRYFDVLTTRLSLRLPNGTFPRYRGLLASNPEPGWVRETFIDQALEDHAFIPALPTDNPHLSPDYIVNLTKTLPEPLVKKYLEGDWDVLEGENYLFPYAWIKAANEREGPQSDMCEAGVDVARFGGDFNVVAIRRGGMVTIPYVTHFQDTMQTAGEVAQVLDNEKPSLVKVDSVGVGAGVCDRLREQGYKVSEVVGGGKPYDSERFYNVRAENHWVFRERLEHGMVGLPNDPELTAQLAGIKFTVSSDRRIKVESKEDMKKRGLRSPDKADAVIMAFAAGSAGLDEFVFVDL